MRSLFMDIGSTNVKFSVYDSASEKYVLSDMIAFPPPSEIEEFTVDRKKIEDTVLSIMQIAKANGCKNVFFASRCTAIF